METKPISKPVINVEKFNLAIMDAVAVRHRLGEHAETVFGIIDSTGAATRARQGLLAGRMIEKARICKLAYVYADTNGATRLAFNSLHTEYSVQEWFDQELLSRIRERGKGVLLRLLPIEVELYFFAKSYAQALPYKSLAEQWLYTFYSQLAEGLTRPDDRRAAAVEVARVERSLKATAILTGLPVELQRQIKEVA